MTLKITIEMDPASGAVNVQTNINNKVLAYGLLECSKEIIDNYFKQNASPIHRPGPADVLGLNGSRKG